LLAARPTEWGDLARWLRWLLDDLRDMDLPDEHRAALEYVVVQLEAMDAAA
jgi:hypothetical protein